MKLNIFINEKLLLTSLALPTLSRSLTYKKKIVRPARRMTKSFMHGSILFPIDHMAAFDAAEGKKMLVSTKIVIHWRETGGLLFLKVLIFFFVCTILSLIDCGCGLQNLKMGIPYGFSKNLFAWPKLKWQYNNIAISGKYSVVIIFYNLFKTSMYMDTYFHPRPPS